MKKRTLLLSILSIIMCLSLTVGGTFALFTSKTETNVAVTSGTVEVTATIGTATYSRDSRLTDDNTDIAYTLNGNTLTIVNMLPGDSVVVPIDIENLSNVAIKYTVKTVVSGELAEYITVDGTVNKKWNKIDAYASIDDVELVFTLPYETENVAQNKTVNVQIVVEAVQGNASVVDIDDNGETSTEVIIESNENSAVVPVGVKMANGEKTATLKVAETTEEKVGNFEISDAQNVKAYEIKIPEVAKDNEKEILVTFEVGTGLNNVLMFHEGVQMTNVAKVADVDEHNEFFYDAAAGTITFATKNFSNFTVVEDCIYVSNADELKAALNENKEIIFKNDITVDATAGGYSVAGIVVNGDVVNGNGFTLTVNNAWGTWDCAIAMTAGTVKNLTVSSAMRGIFMPGASDDVVIDNVIFENVIYTFNSDDGNKNYSVTIKNSALNGWTSFSNVHKLVTFENCAFAEGNGYAFCRPYNKATFVNCAFAADFVMDAIGAVTLDACTLGGVAVTAENVAELVAYNTQNASVVKYVSNADELVEALEAGFSVAFANDIKIEPAKMSNAYGKTGINVTKGQMIDGKGYTLNIKGAGGTWDSGINTTGGVIKNITVTGSFRGIFINHNSTYSEKVVLENVTIDGTVYTISCDQGLSQGLEAINCTFKGWTSYATTLGNAKFVNCYFGEGSGYAFCRPYAATEFVGCEFEADYTMDPRANVTLEGCTLGGVAITAENVAELVTDTKKATVKA